LVILAGFSYRAADSVEVRMINQNIAVNSERYIVGPDLLSSRPSYGEAKPRSDQRSSGLPSARSTKPLTIR
jgi:hypothetical protein